MKLGLFAFILFLSGLNVYALEGIGNLEKNLFEKNQEIKSLESNTESKEALNHSATAGFYPTLSAVGGLGQNRTDDLSTIERGYVGYLDGRINLFRGFKDVAIGNSREIDYKLSKLELEFKKRELRLQLTEVLSDMIFIHKFQSILEESLKVAQTQKQMAAKKVSAGLTGSVDNLEFELRESEILIEQKQITQQHLESHQKLIKLFGEDISDTELNQVDFSNINTLTSAIDTVKIENSVDYQKAQFIEDRVTQEKKEIKSDFLPSLDFTYSVGRLTPSEDSPIKFNENRYALLLTIPLFSGFDTYYRTKSANKAFQAAEKIKFQRVNDIRADLSIVKTKKEELKALYDINEKRSAQSQKYFDLTLSEYRRGVKNSPDLVGATDRLFSSKKRKFEILKQLELLKVKLENYK